MSGRFCRRAAPRQNAAPSGGSEVHAVTSVGALFCRRAAPRQNAAPLGGSAVHAVTSVGAMS